MSTGLHINNILGVGTARHVHSLLQSPHDLELVDMPMGPCVLRWHFSEQRRVFMKQLHADGITNLLRAPHRPDVICTTSYGGEFRFWRADEYAPVTNAVQVSVANHVTRSTPIMHGSWSSCGRYLALSSFHHGVEPGADLLLERNYSFISVYDLSQGLDQPKLVVQQCGIFDGLCEWHATDTCQTLIIAENRPVTQWHEQIDTKDDEIPLLHVLRSDTWQMSSTRAAARPISGMIYDRSRGQVVVAHIDRSLSTWSVSPQLAPNHVRTSGTLPGSGRILCPAVLSNCHVIVAPSEQGLYYSVPVDHVTADVNATKTHVTPGLVYTLVQSVVDTCHLWICNDSGVHRAKFSIINTDTTPQLKIEQLQSITCFELACCGLDICRATGNHVAVGDLTGRVAVWDISQTTPKKVINTEAMIRSLTWWHEHDIQYGTLSGEIYTWSVNSALAPSLVTCVTGGVTCLAWDPISQSVLAASTTEGQVFILSRAQDGLWQQIGLIEARDQQPYVSSREIWSVAWSPCGNFLATGGEDRMTHIHRVQRVTGVNVEPKPEHVLQEKSAAVTCLDWQLDSSNRAVLAVSSDDCTVHCWEVLHERDHVPVIRGVLRTDRRQLMITYCALEQRGTRLFCGTMGGSVWHCHVTDCDSTTAHVRPHFGSVEGLRAMALPDLGITRVVTCASDLTVQITDYPIDQKGLQM